jgi:hypothetical protein
MTYLILCSSGTGVSSVAIGDLISSVALYAGDIPHLTDATLHAVDDTVFDGDSMWTHVSCIGPFCFAQNAPHMTRSTSHVTRLTSHVTRHAREGDTNSSTRSWRI